MTRPTRFAVAYGALTAAHHVADYWVQTHAQANAKGKPGNDGRKACATHVATYTITQGVVLAAADRYLGGGIRPGRMIAALALSAGTHYFADRRRPLERLAGALGKSDFYAFGASNPPHLGTGAVALDQAWHLGWTAIAAAVAAGGQS